MADELTRGALLRRGGSSPWMVAMALLFVCALLSPAEHTHSLFGAGIGINYGTTSKPCPACVSESNPGLAPDAPNVIPAPEVLAAVDVAKVSGVSAAITSPNGRSPPCA